MVSHQPPAAAGSRGRLLAAAAQEFAARGFDGAKVDRIAARARVNKAMLYYHFTNKAALYREVLRDVFGAVACAVTDVRDAGGRPDHQLRAFVAAIATNGVTRPHFPAIWLREIAEGGRHVDAAIVGEIGRVMQVLAGILADGRREGLFRRVHPLIVQMGIVAPLLFFAATAPTRARLHDKAPYPISHLPPGAIVEYVQTATLASLAVPAPAAQASRASSRRSRS